MILGRPASVGAGPSEPFLQRCSDELWTVVRTNKLGLALLHQQPVQHIQNIVGVHLRAHRHAKRFTGVLVQHCKHLVRPSITQLVMHTVDRPDVVGMCGPQADDRASLVIEPPSLLVATRQLQSFFAP